MRGGRQYGLHGGWTRLGLLLALIVWSGLVSLRAETVSIATYNVSNYNLTNRTIEGAFMTAYPKPETEKSALRRVLHELDADVVALQEIGGEEFLDELRRDLRREGMDYPHGFVLWAADDVRRVGVMSRVPFLNVRGHIDLDFKYFEGRERVKRGMLEIQLDTQPAPVTVFMVHLKSRLTERRDDPEARQRRGREATAARDRILDIFPDPAEAWFVVAGDFNDVANQRPLRAFTNRGPLQISRDVPGYDSRRETWTHRYRRADVYSRVDYLMVSAPLWPAVVDEQAVILDSPSVLRASDHRPVKMVLDLSQAEQP